MHPLVERNLPDRPLWAMEGIPSFFEKFYGYWEGDELVVHWGYQNPWRIAGLGTNVVRLNLEAILSTRQQLGEYHESDLRMVSVFLWEQGKLPRFLQLLRTGQRNGYNSSFEAAMEMPMRQIMPLCNAILIKSRPNGRKSPFTRRVKYSQTSDYSSGI